MKDKRRRGLLAVVTVDPWRKLLAITLAVMSWFFVDSRIRRSFSRPVPLVFVGAQTSPGAPVNRLAVALKTDRVVGTRFLDGDTEIRTVNVVVTGPRFRVAEVEKRPLDLQVTDFLGVDWTSRSTEQFTAQNLRGDQRLLDGLTIEIEPSRIRFEVRPLGEQRFALSLHTVDVDPGNFDGRLQYDSAEFTPDSALVRGSADEIATLLRRTDKVFRATMTAGSNDRQARGEVQIVAGGELRFESTPLVTMLLKPLTVPIQLEVPIWVDDLALPPELQGLYRPEERTRTVRINAGGDLRTTLLLLREDEDKTALPAFVAEYLRLVVHVPRPQPGTTPGAEIQDLKARLIVHGTVGATVAPNECSLGELVTVKLKRAP